MRVYSFISSRRNRNYSSHCQLRMAYFFQHMFMLEAVAALYYYYYYFLKPHNFILGLNIKAVHIS